MDIAEFERKLSILRDNDIYLTGDAVREYFSELIEFLSKKEKEENQNDLTDLPQLVNTTGSEDKLDKPTGTGELLSVAQSKYPFLPVISTDNQQVRKISVGSLFNPLGNSDQRIPAGKVRKIDTTGAKLQIVGLPQKNNEPSFNKILVQNDLGELAWIDLWTFIHNSGLLTSIANEIFTPLSGLTDATSVIFNHESGGYELHFDTSKPGQTVSVVVITTRWRKTYEQVSTDTPLLINVIKTGLHIAYVRYQEGNVSTRFIVDRLPISTQ